ncbi:endonuclease/exonuclease/phosphatase family protein [Winogradskyella sp. SYSU M77433]|uniref:endonuclease/exonuclease/phosphatase family protein n=1 Tax=Winogradskyella sp. SYSU M77433 TaxID=3042722 RepID=UPI00248055A3|nr:endonuclease/exonuclease/phosphatase family protein [Winogradskyella sp. SYSU M77433]MDH7913153.1 endonuclease/exonuclease/phosphatase family protein [Winogradskyella sp. SYSU M77433]
MRYFALKNDFPELEDRQRVIKRLTSLKADLDEKVPEKIFNENVLIATWNIRDFDSNQYGYGPRTKEAFFYMSEIISSFDLVAIQEVNEDLYAFNRLMYVMGDQWDYIMTDVTEGHSGNGERMAYLYDTNRVSFQKVAGEIVLTPSNLINGKKQFARTPFLVGFQSGWFNFKLCTVHIYFGADSGAKLDQRIEEIDTIAKNIKKRAKRYDENLILLGDFNIFSPEHETMQALKKHGFVIPKGIEDHPSNMYKTKHYDQIAFMEKKGEVIYGDQDNSAGAYDCYSKVFTTRQFKDYQAVVLKNLNDKLTQQQAKLAAETDAESRKKIEKSITKFESIIADEDQQKDYYKKEWRTFQLSDHLPMWTELKINFSLSYLEKIKSE